MTKINVVKESDLILGKKYICIDIENNKFKEVELYARNLLKDNLKEYYFKNIDRWYKYSEDINKFPIICTKIDD